MTLTRVQSRPAASDPTADSSTSVHLVTFGCQMNKYDSLMVEGRFRKDGYRIVPGMDEADVVLFNTCSVREHAEERVYSWLGELKAEKLRRPDLIIGVLGCLAQRAQDEVFRRAGHVDIVVGTRRFQHLPRLVEEVRERRTGAMPTAASRVLDVDMDDAVEVERKGEVYTGGLNGFLAVMRGCDLSCTYCIVPTTRGKVQSRPIAALVEETRWMVSQGARIVTLLGQTVNSYGEDLPKPAAGEETYLGRQGRPSLADLLYALQEVEGLERIRMITLHPSYVTPAFAKAIADCSKVDRSLPLPAQSGSDEVLRAMKRGYTTELYRKRAAILRAEVPDIELGSDWIVGFPGESDADFEQSVEFLAEIGFSSNYIFKYDPRPETVAHDRTDDVPLEVKKDRNRRLLEAAHKTQFGRMQRHIGREHDVFVEKVSERHAGFLQGRTTYGIPISFEGPPERVGTMTRVRAAEATPYGMMGLELVDEASA